MPADTFIRHYRVVELPYDPPSTPVDGTSMPDGCHAAQMAENKLRDRLAAGEIPDAIALVSPEVGWVSAVGNEGSLDSWAWAWRNTTTAGPGERTPAYFGGGVFVVAALVVDDFRPDPASAEWTTAGSVLVLKGRISHLMVPHWLRPIAELLAETYNVGVYVNPQAVPDFKLEVAPPAVFKNVVSPKVAASLREYNRNCGVDINTPKGKTTMAQRFGAGNVASVAQQFRERGRIDTSPIPWDYMRERLDPLNRLGAEHFGYPVNRYTGGPIITRHHPGAQIPWHIDRNELEAIAYSRTVSFSVMLSEPGKDFTGGDFETDDGPVDVELGDAIAITSVTPHQVTPVETGERFVVVAFGSWDGWNP